MIKVVPPYLAGVVFLAMFAILPEHTHWTWLVACTFYWNGISQRMVPDRLTGTTRQK